MVIIKLLVSEEYYQNLIAPTVNHKCLNLNPLNATFSKYQICDNTVVTVCAPNQNN